MEIEQLTSCWRDYIIDNNLNAMHIYCYGLANENFISYLLNQYGLEVNSQYYINPYGHLDTIYGKDISVKIVNYNKHLLFNLKYPK